MTNRLQQALDLCNRSEFDKALGLLEKITKEDPKNSEAWRLLAQLHWNHQHNPDLAFDELIEALNLDPRNIWALVLMGNLLTREKHDIEHAKKYYERVLEYHPDNAIAINNIGGNYMEMGDYDNALVFLKRAMDLDDSYTNSYYGLALCYYNMERYEEAFETCFKGAKKGSARPENPTVRSELIKLYLTVAQKLVEKANYIKVWNGIKEELEKVDNTKLRLVEDTDINVLAKLQYAPWHGATEHVIRYNPKNEYLDHHFIHEMMHLKMSQQATLAKRGKAVISSEDTRAAFNKRYMSFMKKAHPHMPSGKLKQVMMGLADGLGLQLMNCPLDLFVEHLIYTDYPEVRPIQLLSLFKMEQNNIASVKQGMSSGFFPKEVVYANKVMNLVTSMHFKDIYGLDFLPEYRPTKSELIHAEDLYEEFKAYWDSYKAGDEFEMMEYFVESFGMTDLVNIIDENEISPGMKADLSLKSDLKAVADKALSTDDAEEANAEFAQNHPDGGDPTETMMMAMHMLAAMEYFDTLDERDVHRIALEIATVGVTGINPKGTYSIKSIPDTKFSGYKFLAYYYVSWARAIPEMLNKLGLPFSEAYKTALQLYNAKKNI